jgi:hypothetical protein
MAKSNADRATVEQRHEQWRRIVGRWRDSGLSQAEFCRRQDIPVWKLAWWRKRLAGQADESASAESIRTTSLFVPVGIASASPSAVELELAFPGGRRLRFGAEIDPAKLAAIVAALESTPAGPSDSAEVLR